MVNKINYAFVSTENGIFPDRFGVASLPVFPSDGDVYEGNELLDDVVVESVCHFPVTVAGDARNNTGLTTEVPMRGE